jgi:hypothetical protein
LHESILYIQGQLSEKEAKEVFESKPKTNTVARAKTPRKSSRPKKLKNDAGPPPPAAGAAPVAGPSGVGQGAGAPAGAGGADPQGAGEGVGDEDLKAHYAVSMLKRFKLTSPN